MARFLSLWRVNLSAPWPADPTLCSKSYQKMLETLDDLVEEGEVEEFGFFQDGISGYIIGTREGIGAFRCTRTYQPYILTTVHKIVPYEKGKEVSLQLMRIKAEEEI